jgi:hypothetical protein
LECIGDVLAQCRTLCRIMRIPASCTPERPKKRAACCEIPEPCWMPLPLGTVRNRTRLAVDPAIAFRIANEDLRPRKFQAIASGPAAARVDFEPDIVTLGPKEHGVITARFVVPPNATTDATLEALVWIRGCRDHYLRWIVTVGSVQGLANPDVEISDGPDYVHHWYDHFYCNRPCLHEDG